MVLIGRRAVPAFPVLLAAVGVFAAAAAGEAVAADRVLPCPAREAAMSAPAFPDLAGHWAREEAELLAEAGVFVGEGGRFHPDRPLTRAQAAVVLARISLLLDPARLGSRRGTPEEFADVPSGHWAHSFVRRVAELGVMRGEGGFFHPDRALSRQELAVLVARVLGLERDAEARSGTGLPFSDGDEVAPWARGAVALAAERGLMRGLPGGLFAPRDPVTRGQAAWLMARLGEALGVPGFEVVEARGRLELSGIEGCHFELSTPEGLYVLIPADGRIREEMEGLLGHPVTVKGRIHRGPDIYMRGPLMRVFAVEPSSP